MKIFKYWLTEPDQKDVSRIWMHAEAKVLSVGKQVAEVNGEEMIVVWALVHENNPMVRRSFEVFNTGVPLSALPEEFLGTVISSNGIVWHVFDIEKNHE